MVPPIKRRSRLFALDEEMFYLDESPFFRVELSEPAAQSSPPPEPADEPEVLAMAAMDEEAAAEAEDDGIVDYDGPILLSIGELVVVEEDQTLDLIKPRPFALANKPANTAPLRWELTLMVAAVYLLVIGGLIWS